MHAPARDRVGVQFDTPPSSPAILSGRRFWTAAALVLTLAAFNLTFKLTRETVAQWDESLYALSAIEMLESGDWIGTTFNGRLDYYNSKPPLNAWILAASFKVFGTNLLALRLVSVVAAWATVLVLMLWARRSFDAATAVLAGLVLSTSFGFLHVHSGRSGNPDALMTLLLLLVLVVTANAHDRPWRLAWLGPFMAGVFFLKGMAVLLPAVFVVAVLAWRTNAGQRVPWRPLLVAAGIFVLPTLIWAIARWRLDGWKFLQLLLTQDLIAATTQSLDGHGGSPFYYANVLQRYQYDWLLAGAVAMALNWRRLRDHARLQVADLRRGRGSAFVVLAWVGVMGLVLTAMQTKLPWYLNPLYPAFALATALVLQFGLRRSLQTAAWRQRTVAAVAVIVLTVAQAKLIWQPLYKRDLTGSVQELLMQAGDLRGRVVFRTAWTHDDAFVLRGIARGTPALAMDVTTFLELASPEDFVIADAATSHPGLSLVLANGRHALFRRR